MISITDWYHWLISDIYLIFSSKISSKKSQNLNTSQTSLYSYRWNCHALYHIKLHFYCQTSINRKESHFLFIYFPFVLYEFTYSVTHVWISVLIYYIFDQKIKNIKISKISDINQNIKISWYFPKYHDIFHPCLWYPHLTVSFIVALACVECSTG